MDTNVVMRKLYEIQLGAEVVMSDKEIDFLIDHDLYPSNVVSVPNPQQLGLLDAYVVGLPSCHIIKEARKVLELVTEATRVTAIFDEEPIWDEPSGALTPRGWYWPKSTKRGITVCAGFYVCHETSDSGPKIHCVVFAKLTGMLHDSCYVDTVEDAKKWIVSTAIRAGHKV